MNRSSVSRSSSSSSSPSRALALSRLDVAALALVAFAVRVAHVVALRTSPLFDTLFGDAARYDAWAREIAGGAWAGGPGTFYQSPIYPYLMALLDAAFGHDVLVVRLLQAAAGAAGAALVAVTTARLFGRAAGLAAGAVLALWAPGIFYDGLIQKASLDFLLTSALLFLLVVPEKPVSADDGEVVAGLSNRRLVVAGVVLGLFALNRENALLLLPLVLAWAGVRTARWKSAPAFALAGFLLVLLPVALRNLAVGGELVVTTSQFGTNLWYGYHEGADGSYQPLRAGRGAPEYERRDATAIAERATGRKLDAGGVSTYWRDRALGWIREHPGDAARLTLRKAGLVWEPTESMDHEDLYSHAEVSPVLRALTPLFSFAWLAPAGLFGLWTARRRWRELWLLPAFFAVYTASLAIFLVLGRYRLPLVPGLAIGLGAAVAWGAERLGAGAERGVRGVGGDRGGWRPVALAAAAVAACALVALRLFPAPESAMRARTRANLARALADAGRNEAALRAWRESLDLAPSPRVLVALGTFEARLGRSDDAETHARRALSLDPEEPSAHNLLGTLFAERGDGAGFEAALAAFGRAAALDAENADYLFNYGTALASAGRLEEGEAALRRAVDLDPTCARCRNNLGIALARGGDLADAEREFEQALALEPGNSEPRRNLERVRRSRQAANRAG